MRHAIDGYGERLSKTRKIAMSQAWHAGVIAKSTQTPPLAQLLGEEATAQDPDEMSANLSAWVSATRYLASPESDASI